MELPPHARRRGLTSSSGDTRVGITSACAETRTPTPATPVPPRNYLRMRGEERARSAKRVSEQELPPHARRREPNDQRIHRDRGITSACAEKRDNANRIAVTS